MSNKRKIHTPKFKAKVSPDAIKGMKTASELAKSVSGSSGPNQYLEEAGNRKPERLSRNPLAADGLIKINSMFLKMLAR